MPPIPRRPSADRLQLDYEIKHADPVGIRLITRRGKDWSSRFPLVIEAVNHLKVRCCLIDGEVVCCYERGLARFDVLRRRRNEMQAFLCLRPVGARRYRSAPRLEVRKATLASILPKSRKCIPGTCKFKS